jgi:heme A synthase
LVTLQAVIGISTLVMADPLALALVHQAFAVVVFTTTIVHAQRLSHREAARVQTAVAAEQGA